MPRPNKSNLIAIGLLPLLWLSAPAQARLNLPQSRQVVTASAEIIRAVSLNLGQREGAGPHLEPPVQRLVLGILSQDFREACGEMIENWGDIARGTAQWRVRTLYSKAGRVWLAFRCESRASEYAKDYDERPALLRLDTGKLEFLPLGSDAQNDSTLYHIEFAEVLPLEGAEGVAFKVVEPAGNPCCDGPESRSGERWMVFAETPRGVTELLSVVTARDDSSHCDDPEVDSETTYRAQITLERGPRGTVREVVSTFTEEEKEISYEGEKAVPRIASQRSGTLRYRWNAQRLTFEDIK